MTEVRFTNSAEADLGEIDQFSVSQFGADAAEVYMHGFDGAFARLRDFPLSGSPMPLLGAGLRCLMHRRHRIFYRLEGDTVLVMRVLHHARLLREAMLE